MAETELYLQILENAKKLLLEDGAIESVAFLVVGGDIKIRPVETTGNKYQDAFVLGGLARGFKADRLLILFDAASRQYKTKEEAEYAQANIETEAPLLYPKSMRQELLVLVEIEFPSKKSSAHTLRYSGDHPNFKFEEPEFMGEMGGRISDNLLTGWDAVNEGIAKGEIPELSDLIGLMGGLSDDSGE